MNKTHVIIAASIGIALGFYFSNYIIKYTSINPMTLSTTSSDN